MRNELTEIQLIEHYLLGKLSNEQQIKFEVKMESDADFKLKVEKQKSIMEGLEHVALKQNVKKAKVKYKKLKFWKSFGIGSILVIGLAAAGLGISNLMGDTNQIDAALLNDAKHIKYQLNEEGDSLWSDADANLPSSFFNINNSEDTVIVTENGIVFAIPKGAFLDDNGNVVEDVEIEVKEALTSADILSSGLSTFSGDNLLETGGMFYFNARKNGKPLQINPKAEIIADLPTNEIKEGMQLYDGKRKLDGSIDWVNPKPIETFLTTVDINTLDFYPQRYEPKLSELSHGNESKKWKDSLYYSFGHEEFDEKGNKGKLKAQIGAYRTSVTNGVKDSYLSWDVEFATDHMLTLKPKLNSEQVIIHTSNNGKQYKTKADCEENEVLLDPVYKFEIFDFGSLGEIYAGTKGCWYQAKFQEELKDGDRLWLNLEIPIVDADNNSEDIQIIRSGFEIRIYKPTSETKYSTNQINPSKIQTIWNDKYNNTLLATKEFEERMKHIHETCQDEVLDLYVNNLDKRMATIDSMVVDRLCGAWPEKKTFKPIKIGNVPVRRLTLEENEYLYPGQNRPIDKNMTEEEAVRLSRSPICPVDLKGFRRDNVKLEQVPFIDSIAYVMVDDTLAIPAEPVAVEEVPDLCTIFQKFALQNKGRVKPDGRSASMLSKFYEKHTRMYAKIAAKTQEKLDEKYEKTVKRLNKNQNLNQTRNATLKSKNYVEEFEQNLNEAYRQLGYKRIPTPSNTYRVPITNTGWKNVDRAVAESLNSRTTLDYTDPITGKKAVIKYEPFSVEVPNSNEYDKVFVYLLPDNLSSYMRIKKAKEDTYKENLNELLRYSCVVYAIKGEKEFLWKQDQVATTTYSAEPKEMAKKDIQKILNGMGEKKPARYLFDEVKQQKIIHELGVEKRKMDDAKLFREEIKKAIWSCYEADMETFEEGIEIGLGL